LNYSLATIAIEILERGRYAITSPRLESNYNVTKTDGTLHVNAKNASVTADNKSKTYGEIILR